MATAETLLQEIGTDIGTLQRTTLNSSNTQFEGAIKEAQLNLPPATGNVDLDPSAGTVQVLNQQSDLILTTSISDGQFITLLVYGGGSYITTWPTSIVWWGGETPTLGTIDKIFLEVIGGQLFGSHAGSIV